MAEDKATVVKVSLTKTQITTLRHLAGIKNTVSNETVLKAFIKAVISKNIIVINK